MTRFYPIYPRRSDGQVEVFSKGKRSERNEPTTEQLDQKPDKNGVSDFYREVSLEETKHLDWRRKLAGMLAREMDNKDKTSRGHEVGYILVSFPENYRLYEHVKKTEKDGKLEVKSKTHAAGGNDRQDAYLYGHPAGRKKRYRSPAEFFPHLLWLCTDESGDVDNCSCKLCQPDELDGNPSAPKAKADKASYPLLISDIRPASPMVHVPAPNTMSGSSNNSNNNNNISGLSHSTNMDIDFTQHTQYTPSAPPAMLQAPDNQHGGAQQYYNFTYDSGNLT